MKKNKEEDKNKNKEEDKNKNKEEDKNQNKEEDKNKNKEEDKRKNKEEDKRKNKEEKEKEKKPKTLDEKYMESLEIIKKWENKFMYLQAEMENSQKIMLKRIDRARYDSKVNSIKMFLPVTESFEAAISRLEKDPNSKYESECKNYLNGFKRVQKQFLQILKNNGVKPIDKIDIPFDYRLHDVMMKFEDDSIPDNTVIKIAQKGWYLNENVLKPAKVIVSKKKEINIPVEPKEEINSEKSEKDEPESTEKVKKEILKPINKKEAI
ncbi:MAG: nucleotide exchange factor GrpE [Promethearchaeota archaeon]